MLRPEVADLKAEAARYHSAFLKANEAVTVRELAIDRLTAERDRARDIAVALEGQVAAVRALYDDWSTTVHDIGLKPTHADYVAELRAALDPDPADHGTVSPDREWFDQTVARKGAALDDRPQP